MRFKKIKTTKDGKISMEYEVKKDAGTDEFMFSSVDKALPSFHDALQALAQDIVEMCELPETYLERIFVKGVSLSYAGENETMGAVITAQMLLNKSNVPLNLNTPYKPSEPYAEGGDKSQCLDADCVKRLDCLMEEAERYIKGHRAQGDLFVGKPEMEAVKVG